MDLFKKQIQTLLSDNIVGGLYSINGGTPLYLIKPTLNDLLGDMVFEHYDGWAKYHLCYKTKDNRFFSVIKYINRTNLYLCVEKDMPKSSVYNLR